MAGDARTGNDLAARDSKKNGSSEEWPSLVVAMRVLNAASPWKRQQHGTLLKQPVEREQPEERANSTCVDPAISRASTDVMEDAAESSESDAMPSAEGSKSSDLSDEWPPLGDPDDARPEPKALQESSPWGCKSALRNVVAKPRRSEDIPNKANQALGRREEMPMGKENCSSVNLAPSCGNKTDSVEQPSHRTQDESLERTSAVLLQWDDKAGSWLPLEVKITAPRPLPKFAGPLVAYSNGAEECLQKAPCPCNSSPPSSVQPLSLRPDAAPFNPGGRSGRSSSFNTDAAVFVPGQDGGNSAVASTDRTGTRALNLDAPVFVPGRDAETSSFNLHATVFVPGKGEDAGSDACNDTDSNAQRTRLNTYATAYVPWATTD